MVGDAASEPCPGCGASLPPEDGPRHSYLVSSAACWARYGEVLAREYSDRAYWRAHAITVDAYAVQHPGPDPRAVRSTAVHLVSLGLRFEHGAPAQLTHDAKAALTGAVEPVELETPDDRGALTALDLLAAADAEAHLELSERWGREQWARWQTHRGVIDDWIDTALRALGRGSPGG